MSSKVYDLDKLCNTCFKFPANNNDTFSINFAYLDPEPLVIKLIEDYQEKKYFDTLLYFEESTNSAFPYLLSRGLNVELISLSNKTGLNTNKEIRLDFNKKYCLWLDCLTYDYHNLCSLDKLRKKGINITNVFSFMNMQNCVDLYIKYLYPEIKFYELYKLLSVINYYKANNVIDSYTCETIFFNNDICYKKTKQLLNRIESLYNNTAEHFKDRAMYLTSNYNLNIRKLENNNNYDMKNMSLSYILNNVDFNLICKDINRYGDKLKYIIINRKKVSNIDDNKFLELQNKFNFYIVEHNPEKYILTNTEHLHINNNSELMKTDYDALLLFIDNRTLLNDNMLINLNSIFNNNNVLLYFTIYDDSFNTHELMDFILNLNITHSRKLIGLVINEKTFVNYKNNIIKRIKLLDLVPVYIYFENYEFNDKNILTKHGFRYCLLNNTMTSYINDVNEILKDNNKKIMCKEINSRILNYLDNIKNYVDSDYSKEDIENHEYCKKIYENVMKPVRYNLSLYV